MTKNKQPLLSIIITTYNRYELLKNAIEKVYQQTYKNIEVIVSDDCSTDSTYLIQEDFQNIKYIKTSQNIGYSENSKFAYSHTKGEYVVFLSDDDLLKDNSFFEKAIEKFNQNKSIDTVISQYEIRTSKEIVFNKYNFNELYTPIEFFNWIIDVRMNYADYFGLSTMVFKAKLLNKINLFESIFKDSTTADIAVIFKYISLSNKISFLNIIGYTWSFPEEKSLSNSNRLDLVKQAKSNLAFIFDMDIFLKEQSVNIKLKNIIKDVLNQRVEWIFYAILSEKERLKNNENFQKVLKNINEKEDIYIYGRGWTGLELKNYLNEHNYKVKYFIDDFKSSFEDTISLDKLEKIDEHKIVIITSYKYKDIYNIYRKLDSLNNINILSLLDE